jgi:hypothetical protein
MRINGREARSGRVPYSTDTPRRVEQTRLARSARVKMSCPKYFLSPAGLPGETSLRLRARDASLGPFPGRASCFSPVPPIPRVSKD